MLTQILTLNSFIMKKIVTTEMTEKSVNIVVSASNSEGRCETLVLDLPYDLVSPKVSLQIAMTLVSDPTIPQTQTDGKTESK